MKKTLSLLLFSLFFICYSQNSVEISGRSNVASFKCINKNVPTIVLNDKTSAQNSEIVLAVKDFDCGSKLVNKEFQNTLDTKNFPFLNVTFINFTKTNVSNGKANAEVKLMNKKKTYQIDFTFKDKALCAAKTVKFSDFGITPPKKYGGLIYVYDNLNINFNLKTTNF